jgi:hypothetical protein
MLNFWWHKVGFFWRKKKREVKEIFLDVFGDQCNFCSAKFVCYVFFARKTDKTEYGNFSCRSVQKILVPVYISEIFLMNLKEFGLILSRLRLIL